MTTKFMMKHGPAVFGLAIGIGTALWVVDAVIKLAGGEGFLHLN